MRDEARLGRTNKTNRLAGEGQIQTCGLALCVKHKREQKKTCFWDKVHHTGPAAVETGTEKDESVENPFCNHSLVAQPVALFRAMARLVQRAAQEYNDQLLYHDRTVAFCSGLSLDPYWEGARAQAERGRLAGMPAALVQAGILGLEIEDVEQGDTSTVSIYTSREGRLACTWGSWHAPSVYEYSRTPWRGQRQRSLDVNRLRKTQDHGHAIARDVHRALEQIIDHKPTLEGFLMRSGEESTQDDPTYWKTHPTAEGAEEVWTAARRGYIAILLPATLRFTTKTRVLS